MKSPHEQRTDILIVGGGTGGVAAVLAATSRGHRVVMTECTDWVGGQLTSQAVPPDENLHIETIGVTHITNGCYRLHPVEWNIGESAGLLAARCIQQDTTPRAVRNRPEQLADFPQLLTDQGIPLEWPNTTK